MLILVVWIGAEVEDYHVKRTADTRHFYETPHVCQLQETSDQLVFSTVASAEQAETVAHCGDCGQCSNPNDVNIYDETKNTLFSKTANCAKRGFLWGRKTADKCMKQVGLTDECNDCWVDNIMCDLRYCVFTCIWQGLFDQVDNSESGLNKCTYCDEMRCGPEFITCAGVNRRRSGILSDIDRDTETEVCSTVSKEWWKDPLIQEKWTRQQQQEDGGVKEGAPGTDVDQQEVDISDPSTQEDIDPVDVEKPTVQVEEQLKVNGDPANRVRRR